MPLTRSFAFRATNANRPHPMCITMAWTAGLRPGEPGGGRAATAAPSSVLLLQKTTGEAAPWLFRLCVGGGVEGG
jgi:hypothetical protein